MAYNYVKMAYNESEDPDSLTTLRLHMSPNSQDRVMTAKNQTSL